MVQLHNEESLLLQTLLTCLPDAVSQLWEDTQCSDRWDVWWERPFRHPALVTLRQDEAVLEDDERCVQHTMFSLASF